MPIIIRHIRGEDIPRRWTEYIEENLNQAFTLIIKPEGDLPEISGESFFKRNLIFDLLEGTSGDESSEEWIDLIKSSRTISSVKTHF